MQSADDQYRFHEQYIAASPAKPRGQENTVCRGTLRLTVEIRFTDGYRNQASKLLARPGEKPTFTQSSQVLTAREL